MKLLSIICVLMITALNLVPCADVHDDEVIQTAVSTSNAGSHQDFPAEDYCTPFCQCGCCGSSVIAISFNTLSIAAATYSENDLSYVARHCPSVGQSIWQPPKLIS